MLQFTHDSQPSRVIFGAGRLDRLADELARLGATRALVLCTPGQRRLAEAAAKLLDGRAVGIYAGAVLHVPVEAAAAARAEALRLGADSCVAIGGGSTIGLAKAIALELGLPIVAVPTTYAGSEMTPIWGLTEAGVKRTGRDPRVLPRSVIYDPDLTMSLPPHVAGPSGINALAHCVEALYAPDVSPIIALIAEEGIRALAASLPAVVRSPDDPDARALGAESAPGAIFDLAVALGAPTALRSIGMREEDLDAAAELATRSPYSNPAPITLAGVRRLLDDAFYGRRPPVSYTLPLPNSTNIINPATP